MKRQFLKGMALTAICASLVLAQGPGGRGGVGHGTPPTPAEMVANRVARLTSLLTLTAQQQAAATTIFTNEATVVTGLQTSLQTAHTALQAAVTKNDTATITSEATQIGNLTTQMVEAQAKAAAAFFLLLTPAQQTTYTANSGHGFGGRGFGGPGGGPARFGGARQ